MKIWDLPVRLFHWTLVVGIGFMWFSAETGGLWMDWHMRVGVFLLALVLFRIIDNFELLKSGVTQMGRILTRYLPGELAVVITGFSGTFEPLLDEVISAQENRDLILLADLLEYELSEGLESWAVAIEPLIETLSKVTVE